MVGVADRARVPGLHTPEIVIPRRPLTRLNDAHQCGHPGYAGNRFLKNLQPFTAQLAQERGGPGDIAARIG